MTPYTPRTKHTRNCHGRLSQTICLRCTLASPPQHIVFGRISVSQPRIQRSHRLTASYRRYDQRRFILPPRERRLLNRGAQSSAASLHFQLPNRHWPADGTRGWGDPTSAKSRIIAGVYSPVMAVNTFMPFSAGRTTTRLRTLSRNIPCTRGDPHRRSFFFFFFIFFFYIFFFFFFFMCVAEDGMLIPSCGRHRRTDVPPPQVPACIDVSSIVFIMPPWSKRLPDTSGSAHAPSISSRKLLS